MSESRFRLDDADRFPVHEQDVVGRTNIGLILPDRNAGASTPIDAVLVLNYPTGRCEHRVNLVACNLLWVLVRGRWHGRQAVVRFSVAPKIQVSPARSGSRFALTEARP